MFEWHTHLCEYYNVTPEKALELGTRSSGRKPGLPGSKTCKPVSNMTFEDIWALKERKSIKDIFDFYKDQGAWSAFRQCVRHKDMENLHFSFWKYLIENKFIVDGAQICEYGCGTAPFTTTLLKYLDPNTSGKITLTLADVDSEHFSFAQYRLNRIKEERKLDNITLNFEIIEIDKLPTFNNQPLNALFCFEVLEHVPSPIGVLNNIKKSLIPGGAYIENFIKHDSDDDDDGPDLASARAERDGYYQILNQDFSLFYPTLEESQNNPSCTRIWHKK